MGSPGNAVANQPAPVVLGLTTLSAAVSLPAAVAAVEQAFRAIARGTVTQPLPVGFDLRDGEVHVKAAQLAPDEPVVVKVATGFTRNVARGLPSGDGTLLVVDSTTGQVVAVLLDRGWLTDVRTAAVTALAVGCLAVRPIRKLAVMGTGVQADLTLRTLAAVDCLPADTVLWGRNRPAAQRLAERRRDVVPNLHAVAAAPDAVDDADVVITVTAARSPVVCGSWLATDALVVAVGADSLGKRECDDQVLARASRIVVDSRRQAELVGELQHVPRGGPAVEPVELATVVADGVDPIDGIQLCDLTGVGAADAAIAAAALAASSPSFAHDSQQLLRQKVTSMPNRSAAMSTTGMPGRRREVLLNPEASASVGALPMPTAEPRAFHERLPGYAVTPLHDSPELAQQLGVGRVLVKDESNRLGLPAFKVLGASWATYRALLERVDGRLAGWSSVDELRDRLRDHRAVESLRLLAATDGNHGRAVARLAALLGLEARIYVPAGTAQARIDAIVAEGANCVIVDGTYEDAVEVSRHDSGPNAVVITDVGWDGYQHVADWAIEGYSTIFAEAEDQLAGLGADRVDVVFVPIGAGGLLAAALRHYRRPDVPHAARVVGVEPLLAAGMLASLRAGTPTVVPGPHTSIMAGCNCGEPSALGWDAAAKALDCLIAIEDDAARDAMRRLAAAGIAAGETGSAALAGAIDLLTGPGTQGWRSELGITGDSRVLLLCTEGPTDPAGYRAVVGT